MEQVELRESQKRLYGLSERNNCFESPAQLKVGVLF